MPLLAPRSSGNLIDSLIALRKRALRTGIWFQTLSLEDRTLATLIQRHVKIVKNATLATVVARIMGKLILAIRNCFLNRLDAIGRPIAEAVAMKAYSYGNKEALNWMHDLNYIRYMGVIHSTVSGRSFVATRSGMILRQNLGRN